MAQGVRELKRILSGIFQRVIRNIVSLGDDSTLESDTKPLKVGGKNTPIQISETEVKVNGNNVITSPLETLVSDGLTIDSLDGTTFCTIDISTLEKFKIIGNTDYQVQLISQGEGDILISSGDNITLDATDALVFDSDGNYIMKQDGTEFSAANSAYAGMLLGYTSLLNDAADTSYAVTASFVTIDADTKVTFVAPPSRHVEISTSVYVVSTATRQLYLGLSDNATYNAVDVTHEHKVYNDTADHIINHQWVIKNLSAGTSYTYWLGAKADQAGRVTLHWGGDATDKFAPFIIKATALPATLYEG